MPRPARPMSPTSPDSASPHAQAPHLASQRGRPRDRRGLPMHRDPRGPSPPPSPCKPAEPPCIHQEPGPGRRAGRTGCRARPSPNASARNISAHHGQVCDTADTTGQPARGSSPERPAPAGTEEPAPQGKLEMRAQKAGAGPCLPYLAAARRRATLALMHSATPTARTPTIAVTQAAKSPKCRAGIPMSRPTT